MNSSSGRNTVAYLVRCALPSGHSITKKDKSGNSYTFSGALGLAPGWENGATTQQDRYWISSCLMAHINTSGQHIPIWLDGLSPVGWGRNASYPIQEGTFVGDLFASPPIARYCGGRGYGSNIVAGRIGDTSQQGEPYSVIVGNSGSTRCDDNCARDPSGDGYTSCLSIPGQAITVWRQLSVTPNFSFESNMGGFTLASGSPPTQLSLSTDKHLDGSRSLLATINASGGGNLNLQLWNPPGIKPGKNMTFFVNVIGSGWNYVQAYAQDGPGKNYRWTNSGYNNNQVIPGEWNSIVVAIPSDFSASGSNVGVQLNVSKAGTYKLYIDAVTFN